MLEPTTAGVLTPLTNIVSRRVSYAAEVLARHPNVFLVFASAGYFAITCYRAQHKLFWFDEIFTFYVARLPDAASIWSACTHGADFNPPLLYLLARWSQDLFGVNELGTRMPEILGFWVFCLCLYRFVSVRTHALAGFIALLYPLTAGAYWYAYEARSHGLVLGFFGLALLSWQAATSRARRWMPIAGLAASLTLAALCHCYAFLLFIPLGFGELTRTIVNRHFDLRVWCALVVPAIVSVFTVLPLLHGYRQSVQYGASLKALLSSWDLDFEPGLMSALVLLLAAVSAMGTQTSRGKSWSFQWHEFALVVVTVCTPFFVFLSARLTHAPLYARYSLIVVAGAASLIGMASARRNITALVVLSMVVITITWEFASFHHRRFVIEPATELEVPTGPGAESLGFSLIAKLPQGGDPIVLMDNLTFGPMFHYAPASILPRLVFLVPDINGEGYQRLQQCCHAPGAVFSAPQFLSAHRKFFAYSGKRVFPSAIADLHKLGGEITVVGCDTEGCLFRVQL